MLHCQYSCFQYYSRPAARGIVICDLGHRHTCSSYVISTLCDLPQLITRSTKWLRALGLGSFLRKYIPHRSLSSKYLQVLTASDASLQAMPTKVLKLPSPRQEVISRIKSPTNHQRSIILYASISWTDLVHET